MEDVSAASFPPMSSLNNSTSFISESLLFFCPEGWLSPNNVLFQLANAFLFLSYLAPAGMYGLLYLRSCLMLGSFFFSLWGLVTLCALDTFVWNALFTVINLVHICVILYMLRPVTLSRELEAVYREFFKPLQVTRLQFKKAVHCMREIQTLKPREPYCVEKLTKVERLSLVLSGRLVVSQNGRVLHIIDSRQFLDSPEWFGVCTGDHYKVSITAVEECRVLVWHRDKLKLSISNDQFLQAVFDNILGKDVVKKLMLVTESSCNGINLHVYEDTTSETVKLLPKIKESQSGISVLLNRQISNRDLNVWNIPKLTERDFDAETTV